VANKSDYFEFEKGLTIRVVNKSILEVDVEVITNAANSLMNHFGGIARVISDAAGWQL